MQILLPIPGLPLALVLSHDSSIIFTKTIRFKCIYDLPEDGIPALFDEIGFNIGDESFIYDFPYRYKEIPGMLQWLVQQKLELPDYK